MWEKPHQKLLKIWIGKLLFWESAVGGLKKNFGGVERKKLYTSALIMTC